MATLGVTSASLVGHSMGSLVAYDCAVRYSESCKSIALLGAALPMPVGAPLLQAAQENHHAAIEMSNIWSHSVSGRVGGAGVPGEWPLELGERLMERARPNVLYTDLAACNAFSAPEPGALLTTPVLLILGDADQMTPATRGLAIADQFARARVVRLAGCGHSMMSEQPNAVLDALIEYLPCVYCCWRKSSQRWKALDISSPRKVTASLSSGCVKI